MLKKKSLKAETEAKKYILEGEKLSSLGTILDIILSFHKSIILRHKYETKLNKEYKEIYRRWGNKIPEYKLRDPFYEAHKDLDHLFAQGIADEKIYSLVLDKFLDRTNKIILEHI